MINNLIFYIKESRLFIVGKESHYKIVNSELLSKLYFVNSHTPATVNRIT